MGVWLIDTISYDGSDIKGALLSNGLTFRKNYECYLPIIDINDRNTDKKIGIWRIDKINATHYLVIESTNKLMKGKYQISKMWNEHDNVGQGEFLKMELINDTIRMICTRDAADVPF